MCKRWNTSHQLVKIVCYLSNEIEYFTIILEFFFDSLVFWNFKPTLFVVFEVCHVIFIFLYLFLLLKNITL